MHRDLKLANIFLKNDQIVIGDFGFASLGLSVTTSILGSPAFMAPEVLNSHGKPYNNSCDIWSIGVCYYYMLFGILPWKSQSSYLELVNEINKYSGDHLRITDEQNKMISPQAKYLLIKLLQSKVEN